MILYTKMIFKDLSLQERAFCWGL